MDVLPCHLSRPFLISFGDSGPLLRRYDIKDLFLMILE